MGQSISRPIKHKQKFIIRTSATINPIDDEMASFKDIAYKYLRSAAFKKRVIFDLDSNFKQDKKIRIVVTDVTVTKTLHVKIEGYVDVLKKDEAEDISIVKSVLEEAIPQYSSQGEPMPGGKAKFMIQFMQEDTNLTLPGTDT